MNSSGRLIFCFRFWLLSAVLLGACAHQPMTPASDAHADQRNEVVLFALDLLDRDYKFGGNHPDTGLDCSGLVSYVYAQAAGIVLPHNAALIARAAKVIRIDELHPGDLVFFNTNGHAYSHVGIYIGEGRFVHAPSRNGKIRTDTLVSGYFKDRLEAARTLF